MITIKLGNLLKIELGEDEGSQIASPARHELNENSQIASPAMLELNEAIKELLENLLDKGPDGGRDELR